MKPLWELGFAFCLVLEITSLDRGSHGHSTFIILMFGDPDNVFFKRAGCIEMCTNVAF